MDYTIQCNHIITSVSLQRTLKLNEAEDEGSSSASKRVRQQPPSPQPGPSHAASQPSASDSGLLETLICAICHELLYDCVSVQPCLHSFCAGCFSDWMQGSCPQVNFYRYSRLKTCVYSITCSSEYFDVKVTLFIEILTIYGNASLLEHVSDNGYGCRRSSVIGLVLYKNKCWSEKVN